MLRSQISILGLYQYNENVFAGLRVPQGMEKDNLISEILSQCAELELVYPSYDVMSTLISTWTTSELPQWERMYKAVNEKYNPLWNVDGTETETIERELEGSAHNEAKTEDDNISSRKGYNSNDWAESDKQEGNGKSQQDGTQAQKEKIITTKVRGGNIGVTMSQQLLRAELDIIPDLNPYQFIVNSFKRRFCLLVY